MMMSSQQEEEFSAFENKVDEVMQILNLMSSDDKEQSVKGIEKANSFLEVDKPCKVSFGAEKRNSFCSVSGEGDASIENVDIDNFLVKTNYDRTVINKKDSPNTPEAGPVSQDAQAFMAAMEKDANRRTAERKQRESVAQELRKMGNQAFRSADYERAVSLYSKALDQVRDSPILWNNRALCYIRLSLFKRAIIDCDFVLNKLDEKNLRSWLYRAKAYYSLGEKRLYEKSIQEAKKHHPKELNYIDKIIAEVEESTSGGEGDGVDDMNEGDVIAK